MIYWPQRFDLNEWVVIGMLVASALIVRLVRRRFSLSLCVVMISFSIATARAFDHMLAWPGVTDLYDIMDIPKIEWSELLIYLMFAPYAYLFITWYDQWKPEGLKVPLYILGWSLFSTAVEMVLAYYGNVFQYKQWNPWYSFIVYLFIQPLTLWLFRFLKADEPSYDKT